MEATNTVAGGLVSTKPKADKPKATKDDAAKLANCYLRLKKSAKNMRDASKAMSDLWLSDDPSAAHADCVKAYTTVIAFEEHERLEVWKVLKSLPPNTVAPGGATPQTVALEYFNRGLNRNLSARLTAAEAKRINKVSFA